MQMHRRKTWMILNSLIVLGLLVGCAVTEVKPTPTPVPPGVTVAPPTPTPMVPAPTPVAEKPRYGGIITVSLYAAPASLDPHQETYFGVLCASQPSLNNLIRFDTLARDYVIEPDLGERWEVSPDGRVYTFHLRKGVKFHDGKDFTSADVKFSIERIRFPLKGQLSPNKAFLESIEKVEAPDPYKVVITLAAPSASVLYGIAEGHMNMVAKHVVEPLGPAKINRLEHLIGTGPFILKEYDPAVSWHSIRNPNYWKKGLPYLDGLTYYIIADPSTRFAALRTKRVLTDQKSPGLSLAKIELIEKQLPELAVGYSVPRAPLSLYLNLRRKPFSDLRVRKAVHLAIDREKALKLGGEGLGEITAFQAPGTYWALPKEELSKLPGYRYPKEPDIAEAKRLMAEAGYPDGFDLEVIVRIGRAWENFGLVAVEELKKLGIRPTIKLLETTAFFATFDVHQDFTAVAYIQSPGILEPTGTFSREFLADSPRNNTGFSHPKVDELILKQERELNKEKRREIARELELLLLDEGLSLIPVYSLKRIVAHWKILRNWPGMAWSFEGNQFEQVWLAK